MSTERIAADLHDKMAEHLRSWLDREFAIAAVVLPPADCAMLLMSLASGQMVTAAATIANMGTENVDPAKLYDDVIKSLIVRAEVKKAEAMTRVAEARKARAS
jgi:hypothetical protein